jgi:hypothetical protein
VGRTVGDVEAEGERDEIEDPISGAIAVAVDDCAEPLATRTFL